MRWYGPTLEFIGAPGSSSEDVINFADDTFKVVLLFDTYTYDSTHEFMDEIVAGHRAAAAVELENQTWAAQVNGDGSFAGWRFGADATTFPTVTISDTFINAIALIHWDTDEAASRIVGYIDDHLVFPFKPDGGDIVVQWPEAGIARLNTGV